MSIFRLVFVLAIYDVRAKYLDDFACMEEHKNCIRGTPIGILERGNIMEIEGNNSTIDPMCQINEVRL